MIKLYRKLKNSVRNTGSTLVLVIVALGFVGILAGALLTTVGYAYRQKLYDYNAKSNFYILEQAMDEVYAGLGAKTMEALQEAYQETREEAIYYDTATGEYKTMSDEEANELFKKKFMEKVANGDTFSVMTKDENGKKVPDTSKGILAEISNMISNNTVEFVADNLTIEYSYDVSGSTSATTEEKTSSTYTTAYPLVKVTLQNVTLTRTANYNRSQANGDFQQTISTDIEIAQPDFNVSFDDSVSTTNNLFDFCMIADSGVEINQTNSNMLTISGNIYAANDFYDKDYNYYGSDSGLADVTWTDESGNTTTYNMAKVSNYSTSTLYNANLLATNNPSVTEASDLLALDKSAYLYDGDNLNSRYSGLYINGSNVNIFAKTVIVPGSIAVMNGGSLVVYGVSTSTVGAADVWADEIVLAGTTVTATSGTTTTYSGSTANFTANMYIKDDTQLDSEYSTFKLSGAYYGYSNSTAADSRSFIPTVKASNNNSSINVYQESGDDASYLRSHYNSSAIIVNGQHSVLNLVDATTLYIAGRTYIELSKTKYGTDSTATVNISGKNTSVTTNTYEYNSDLHDYKTGESISIKSTQLAYKPDKAPSQDTSGQYWSELASVLRGMTLFTKYFSTAAISEGALVPVVYSEQTVSDSTGKESRKVYYYLDFDYAYDNNLYDTTNASLANVKSADDLSELFIQDYFNYILYANDYQEWGQATFLSLHTNMTAAMCDVLGDSVEVEGSTATRLDVLVDVTNYSDFVAGYIGTPNLSATSTNVYTSGAITTAYTSKSALTNAISSDDEVEFYISAGNDDTIQSTLLDDSSDTSASANALEMSKSYAKHYKYLKWALTDLSATSSEAQFVDTLDESAITPINKFMNFANIDDGTDINPKNLPLEDYVVYVSDSDVYVTDDISSTESSSELTGIIIAKGDVYFKDSNVKKFNGIIITGGKIYVDSDMTSISSSDLCTNVLNAVVARAKLISNTDTTKQATAKLALKVLKCFRDYEDYAEEIENSSSTITTDDSSQSKSISKINYSDVVRYSNWMRNVD